jgi:hypothetical protein
MATAFARFPRLSYHRHIFLIRSLFLRFRSPEGGHGGEHDFLLVVRHLIEHALSDLNGLLRLSPASIENRNRCRQLERRPEGVVMATMARFDSMGTMAPDDLVCPPSVSACDHPARRLAVYAFHAQLSRRRRSASGARSGYLLRNGATMGFEVRAVVRPRTSPSTPSANVAMASR